MPRQTGGLSFTPQWNFTGTGDGTSLQIYNSINSTYSYIPTSATAREFASALINNFALYNLYRGTSNTTYGSLVFLGDSNSEAFGATSIDDSYVNQLQLIFKNINLCDNSNVGIANFSDPTKYGLTLAGTTSITNNGPIGQSLTMTPGSTITFTGAYSFVDMWYKQLSGAGNIEIRRNGTLYRTIAAAGSTADINSYDGSTTTPNAASATYEIKCTSANVTIMVLYQLVANSNPRIYFQRDGKSGYATTDFVSRIADVKKMTLTTNNTFIIAVGTNNIYSDTAATTVEDFKSDIATLYNGLKDDASNVIFLMPPKAGTGTFPPVLAPYEDYLDAALSICNTLGIPFINTSYYDYLTLGYYSGDELHLNNDGGVGQATIIAQNLAYPVSATGGSTGGSDDLAAVTARGNIATGNVLVPNLSYLGTKDSLGNTRNTVYVDGSDNQRFGNSLLGPMYLDGPSVTIPNGPLVVNDDITGENINGAFATMDFANGGGFALKTGGAINFIFTTTKNITGSGSNTDANAYVYGNNSFSIWTGGVKRIEFDGTGNIILPGFANSQLVVTDASKILVSTTALPTGTTASAPTDPDEVARLADVTAAVGVSGTYTPTITSIAGSFSPVAYACQYTRVGNIVTVFGRLDATSPVSGNIGVAITLPVASNLSSANQLNGMGHSYTNGNLMAVIIGEPSGDKATFTTSTITVPSSLNQFFFSFSYEVI